MPANDLAAEQGTRCLSATRTAHVLELLGDDRLSAVRAGDLWRAAASAHLVLEQHWWTARRSRPPVSPRGESGEDRHQLVARPGQQVGVPWRPSFGRWRSTLTGPSGTGSRW